jgi:hypothetical protein
LTACSDARNYIVLGDPAVRLVFGAGETRKVETMAGETVVIPPVNSGAPVVSVSSATVVAPETALRNFGIKEDVLSGLNAALASIGDTLQKAVQTVTTLTVTTYTNGQLDKGLQGATLRAQTKISLTGDTESIVPEDAGKVDDAVWKIHTDALDRAIQNRTKLLRVILSLLGPGK